MSIIKDGFIRIENEGSRFIAVFKENHSLNYMEKSILIKRVNLLKALGADTIEGENALKAIEVEEQRKCEL